MGCPRECANMGCFTNQYLTMTAEKQTRRGLISQETEGMLLDELSAFKVTAAPRVATWRKVNKLGMEVEHVYMF